MSELHCYRSSASEDITEERAVEELVSFIQAQSRRAAAGRAELRALTFLEARYGAISAKMQTAGALRGNCGVIMGPHTFRRGLIAKIRQNLAKI